MKQWGFPKTLRLQTSSAFQTVFDHVDKKFYTKGLMVLVKKNGNPQPRLGLVISKKNLSLSCQRNTLKRLIRESVRLNQSTLTGLDLVVVARRDIIEVDRQSLWQALNQLWQTVSAQRGKF
ncbi:MAG: ribonuclease P protein component [Gammaproteobacteria bacterium]